MDYGRTMIYFSVYENGLKVRPAGYAAVFTKEEVCDIQLYYREIIREENVKRKVQPVYIFRDGTVVKGEELYLQEGMATMAFTTARRDFLQSGRSFEELEVIYLDGIVSGICGGRPDGKALFETVDRSVVRKHGRDLQERPEAVRKCPGTCGRRWGR